VHASNQEGTTKAGIRGEAVALLEMAKLLEADAFNKREQAYRMDPGLKPKAKAKQNTNMDMPTLEVLPEVVEVKKTNRRPAPKKQLEHKTSTASHVI
jgi:hypothetical protein